MADKKKKAAKKTVTKVKRTPRTGRLPGMEDAGIRELEKIAEDLSDVRTERIALQKDESRLQEDLLAVMKKHRKNEYHHEEVHVWVVATEMKVKVKIGEVTPQKEKQMQKETATVKELEEMPEPAEIEAAEEVEAPF